MSKSRMPLWLGLGVAGAGGYYLYSAGGDTKSATRHFEDDASRAAAKVKSEFSGAGKGEKEVEQTGKKIGAKADEAADVTRDKAKRAETEASRFTKDSADKLEHARKDTAKELNQTVDEIDRTVERKTSEAKSGISNWFGGGKK